MSRKSASDGDWSDPGAQAVARFARDLGGLIDIECDSVLVAVSGGADSLALLLLARAVLHDRVAAATVDHGLRPGCSQEAEYVAAICADRGIPHATLRGELPPRVGRTANVSARARDLRYRLLDEARAERRLDWLATAHHADDQLETFVMRANRGAGVAGLAGIRRRGARTIRPVLGWRRAELAEFVAAQGVAAIEDPTNADDRFDRARLRKLLAEVDWLDPRRIGDSAAALAHADAALTWAAARVYDDYVIVAPGERSYRPHGVPVELTRRTIVRCLTEIDPHCDADGPGVGRLALALADGRASMLGDVLVTPDDDDDGRPIWHFRKAPPRRAT